MVKFGPVVAEEKIFVKVNDAGRRRTTDDGRQTTDDGRRTPSDGKSSLGPLGQVS